MVAVETSHTLLRLWLKALIALRPAVPALWSWFDTQTSTSCKLSFSFVRYNEVLKSSVLFTGFIWKQPSFAPNPVDQFHCMTWQMLNATIFLGHCITTQLVFDYPKFKESLLNTLQSSKSVGVKSVGTKVNFWEKWRKLRGGGRLHIAQ